MAKIIAPNKAYNGISASVPFVEGVGETADSHLIEWFRAHGYEVIEEPEDKPIGLEDGKPNEPIGLEDGKPNEPIGLDETAEDPAAEPEEKPAEKPVKRGRK